MNPVIGIPEELTFERFTPAYWDQFYFDLVWNGKLIWRSQVEQVIICIDLYLNETFAAVVKLKVVALVAFRVAMQHICRVNGFWRSLGGGSQCFFDG